VLSRTTQKFADGHDTDVRSRPAFVATGADHRGVPTPADAVVVERGEIVSVPDDELTDVVPPRVGVVVVAAMPWPVVAPWAQPAPSKAALRTAPRANGVRPFLTVLS
jgi:hypothetical protein